MQRRNRKGQYKATKKDGDRKSKEAWGSKQKKPSRSKVKRHLKDGDLKSKDELDWMEHDDN
jgi:hypothetical protein